MTREEAIKRIKHHKIVHKMDEPNAIKISEALDMAIEALSAKPQTDLISRADAMGAVQDHFNADGFKGYDDGQKMMDRIKALPSAEAETSLKAIKRQIDEHWYLDQPSAESVQVVRCGECKHLQPSGKCEVFADDGIRPSAADYCSYGERKGGDTE